MNDFPHRRATAQRARQHGVSLVESLVAFVVLALGTAAAAHLQGQLRLAGDVARERSEAIRFGQTASEDMRSFAALDGTPGQRAFTDIVSGDASVAAASSARARRLPDRASRRRPRFRRDEVDTRRRALARPRRQRARGRAALVDRRHRPGLCRLARARDRRDPERATRRLRARARLAADRAKARRRSQRLEAERARTDRAGVRRPQRRHRRPLRRRRCDAATRDLSAAAPRRCATGRWLLVAGTIRFASAAPPIRPPRTSRRCRPRRPHASRRQLSGAGRLLQRIEEDGALPRQRQPSPRRCRRRRDRRGGGDRPVSARERRPLPRLALRRHAARRRSLVGAGRVAWRRLDDRRRQQRASRLSLRRRPRSTRSMRTSRLPVTMSTSASRCSDAISWSSAATNAVRAIRARSRTSLERERHDTNR